MTKMNVSPPLEEAILALANAMVETGEALTKAPINKQLGKLDQENVQGETQSELDVISNDIFMKNLEDTHAVIGVVSEEIEKEIIFDKPRRDCQLLVFFDPLDGSSNIDPNITVGSIFSIYELKHDDPVAPEDFLQTGRDQVAAGFSVYGSSMTLILTVGNGTFKFCYDQSSKFFSCTEENIKISPDANEFAINMSNQRFWSKPIQKYVEDCLLGETDVRKKDFNMRWIGSMVADLSRVLTRGGIYLYPKGNKKPERAGRLRLMYEINPMALIIEQSKGSCTDGVNRILDIKSDNIHQRAPVVAGSKNEVDLVKHYYQDI